MSEFFSAKSLFTGTEWINETAIEIKDGKIDYRALVSCAFKRLISLFDLFKAVLQ